MPHDIYNYLHREKQLHVVLYFIWRELAVAYKKCGMPYTLEKTHSNTSHNTISIINVHIQNEHPGLTADRYLLKYINLNKVKHAELAYCIYIYAENNKIKQQHFINSMNTCPLATLILSCNNHQHNDIQASVDLVCANALHTEVRIPHMVVTTSQLTHGQSLLIAND